MLLESMQSYCLHRRDHHRTGPLVAAREKAKRNKYILCTFWSRAGPRLAITAKEVIAGCFSLILKTLPFVQAQTGQCIYTYSLLYAYCILLLVVLLLKSNQELKPVISAGFSLLWHGLRVKCNVKDLNHRMSGSPGLEFLHCKWRGKGIIFVEKCA